MRGFLRIVGFVLIGLTMISGSGCDNDNDNWGQVGVVQFLDVGGECWVIKVEDDSVPAGYYYFELANLTDEFRVNGLWVRFEYVLPDEWVSICMVGEGIILTRIEEL